MIITFNILNQIYGANTDHAELIRALLLVPFKEIEDATLPPGFVRREWKDRHIAEVFNYLNLNDYWLVVEGVVNSAIAGNTRELITHNRAISDLSIEVFVKASNALLTTELPQAWPNSEKEGGIQMTMSEWLDIDVTVNDRGNGTVDFALINNKTHPSLPVLKALFDLKNSNPSLGIELMHLDAYSEYKSGFEIE